MFLLLLFFFGFLWFWFCFVRPLLRMCSTYSNNRHRHETDKFNIICRFNNSYKTKHILMMTNIFTAVFLNSNFTWKGKLKPSVTLTNTLNKTISFFQYKKIIKRMITRYMKFMHIIKVIKYRYTVQFCGVLNAMNIVCFCFYMFVFVTPSNGLKGDNLCEVNGTKR